MITITGETLSDISRKLDLSRISDVTITFDRSFNGYDGYDGYDENAPVARGMTVVLPNGSTNHYDNSESALSAIQEYLLVRDLDADLKEAVIADQKAEREEYDKQVAKKTYDKQVEKLTAEAAALGLNLK